MNIVERIDGMLRGDTEMKTLGLKLKEEYNISLKLNINTAKDLQKEHKEFIIGGSLALFLHGIRLKRWKYSNSDLDIISPYFILPTKGYVVCRKTQGSSDFDYVINLPGVNMDLKIDPKASYEWIEYQGDKFKVSSLLTIWEAKTRYAMQGYTKHENDLLELCGKELKEEARVWGS